MPILVIGRNVRPFLIRQRGRLLGQRPDVLVHVVGGVRDVLVAVVPRQPRGLAVRGEVEGLGFLGVRRDGQPHAARDAAGQEVDLLLAHQLAGGLHGLVRLELVVAEDELDRPAQDAARVVDLLGRHQEAFLVGEGVDGGQAAVGVDLADPDRLGLGGRGPHRREQHEQQREQRQPSKAIPRSFPHRLSSRAWARSVATPVRRDTSARQGHPRWPAGAGKGCPRYRSRRIAPPTGYRTVSWWGRLCLYPRSVVKARFKGLRFRGRSSA